MRVAAFILVEVVILAVAHACGGPAWAAVAAVACVAHVFAGFEPAAIVAALPAVGWLAAARLTGNRELFFPYSMLLATSALLATPAATSPAGVAAAGGVVAAFLLARVVQQASGRVLAIELAAAAVVMVAAVAAQALLPRLRLRWWLPAAASLAAYACLAL
ncbi:MAG: hypothetical protein ACKO40_03695 [Planctomycetaceae bacterium]